MQLTLFPEQTIELELNKQRQKFEAALLANQTVIGYRYDWRLFQDWCKRMERTPIPAKGDTVPLFLTDQLYSGQKVSTVRRRYHAIAHHHRVHCRTEIPWRIEALNLLRGAQRLRCEKPRKMRPITIADLHSISEVLANDCTPLGIRDRTIILLGFASALRSASLAALTLDDIEFCEQGLILTIPREKQDQEGRGRFIGIPFAKSKTNCAVHALRAWLPIRPTTKQTRALFVSVGRRNHGGAMQTEAIHRLVKRTVARIGLNPKSYGSHSLRSGFIIAAGEAGVTDLLIADQTGHRDMDCLRKYFKKIRLFHRNPCAALDL
jgi:site-specific recombinase XerD